MEHYVYIHYKADTKEPFYIGKGTKGRHRKTHGRNQYWQRVKAKHGFISEIVKRFESEKEALDYEILLICQYTQEGYPLTNLTKGGEGVVGLVFSADSKEKLKTASTEMMARAEFAEKVWEGHRKWKSDPENLNIISGENGSSFIAKIESTNLTTGETNILIGAKEIREAGFDHTKVYACVNGKRKTHKQHTFKRI